MSSEALEKTVMTDNWQFFPKKLFQNFFHHKKILKATKLQFKFVTVHFVPFFSFMLYSLFDKS